MAGWIAVPSPEEGAGADRAFPATRSLGAGGSQTSPYLARFLNPS
jgi:hypothetical protein